MSRQASDAELATVDAEMRRIDNSIEALKARKAVLLERYRALLRIAVGPAVAFSLPLSAHHVACAAAILLVALLH